MEKSNGNSKGRHTEGPRAKKSLGQNFLKSKAALREIVEASDIQPGDTILEVGPGKGALTEALLSALGESGKIIAIEKDDRLITHLQSEFSKQITAGKLQIVHGDALEIDPHALGLMNTHAGTESKIGGYKIAANIPYYITGQFLRTFLSGNCQPSRMVLMLQREVAKRIVAKGMKSGDPDGKESILSLSVKAYGKPKYISTVEAKYFSPEPNVDSAILLISDISKDFFEKRGGGSADPGALAEAITEKQFFTLVKKGFLHKRKMLAQNLEIPAEKRAEIFTKISADQKVRAEDLSIEQWRKLAILLTSSAETPTANSSQ